MKIERIRDVLGIFYLGVTGFLGAYIILFQETVALPISAEAATSAFQIIVPTFVAQLALIFRWIANPPTDAVGAVTMPSWAVLGPPACVLIVLGGTIAALVLDSGGSLDGGTMFKNAVTFCVSLLGATSVIIIARVFAKSEG